MKNEPSLAKRVVGGGFWVAVTRVCIQFFSLIQVIVVARVLGPEDLGLVGAAFIGVSALERFSETGFELALVQRQDDIRPYLNTAWSIQVIRGFILGVLMFAVAPLLAAFFDMPEVVSIARVVSFVFFLDGFMNISLVFFSKDLEFRKQFVYQILSTFLKTAVTIWLVIWTGNLWGLVYGVIAGKAVSVVLSYWVYPYMPALQFDFIKASQLFNFSKWIMGTKFLAYFVKTGDNILVGRFLGAVPLGFYQMAYRVANLPVDQAIQSMMSIVFPAFSRMQGDAPRIRKWFLKAMELVSFIMLPLSAGGIILASGLARLVLGEKWMPMVPALQVLMVFGLTRALNIPFASVLNAVGRPESVTASMVWQIGFIAVAVYPFFEILGMEGIALAFTLSNVFRSGHLYGCISKTIILPFADLCRTVRYSGLAAVAMGCVMAVLSLRVDQHSWAGFTILLLGGAVIYVTVFLLLDTWSKHNFFGSILGAYRAKQDGGLHGS